MNERHCCFTGHRKLSEAVLNALPETLDSCIESLHSEGIDTFYAGGALGFDTLAAEAVIRFREKRPGVRLILALPCKNQTRRWKRESVERYTIPAVCGDATNIWLTAVPYASAT